MEALRLIDSHCHLNFAAYRADQAAVIGRAAAAGIGMLVVGSQRSTSERAVDLALGHENIWAVVGLHPIHLTADITETDTFGGEPYSFVTRQEVFDASVYRTLVQRAPEKVVALGEVGLDYYHAADTAIVSEDMKATQRETLEGFLTLAQELNRPLVFHCRGSKDDPYGAYTDLYEILATAPGVRGVVHCFGGTYEQAQRFASLGLSIGITGIVTFKKAAEVQRIATELPLESLLIETDAPYLAPEPHRGQRNEPAYVERVAEKIAELRGVSVEAVTRQTLENTRALFGLE